MEGKLDSQWARLRCSNYPLLAESSESVAAMDQAVDSRGAFPDPQTNLAYAYDPGDKRGFLLGSLICGFDSVELWFANHSFGSSP